MGYEIKQKDWQTLSEDAQREVYNYFLFIKQRAEMPSHNDADIFTLTSYETRNVEYSSDLAKLPNDDVNEIWTISK